MNHLELRYRLLSLNAYPEVKAVVLFGSRAKGTARADSDYDLAVKFTDESSKRWDEIEAIAAQAVMLPADVVDMRRAVPEIAHAVKASTEIVFWRADWYPALVRLNRALLTLEDIVGDPDDEKHKQRDALIVRFQYVIELFWKLFKELAEAEGFDEKSPRKAIARAVQQGWISDENAWRSMWEDRNNLVHSYNEVLAEDVAARVQRNFPQLKQTYLITEMHALSLMENR